MEKNAFPVDVDSPLWRLHVTLNGIGIMKVPFLDLYKNQGEKTAELQQKGPVGSYKQPGRHSRSLFHLQTRRLLSFRGQDFSLADAINQRIVFPSHRFQ